MRENKLVHWEIKERIQHLADYADDFFVEDNYGQYAWIREDIPENMREFIFEVLFVCSDMLEEINQEEREMKRKIVKQSFDKCVEKNGGALEKIAEYDKLSEEDNI